MTAELEDMMQEEMQEKILRNIAKNGKLSTEDLAAMLAASPEEIEKEMNAMEEQGIMGQDRL